MAIYSVAEARDKLPALLMAVERGEQVSIARRGKLIAELRAIDAPARDLDETPPYGSTAWLLAELTKLPPVPGDLQATLYAHREGRDD